MRFTKPVTSWWSVAGVSCVSCIGFVAPNVLIMSLLCYNKGCGQRFEAQANPEDACTFHPGVPVFHDALKGWSCCKRRTTDFSDFLSIAGCTKGPHNSEKPPEPVKPEVDLTTEKKELSELKPKFQEHIIRAPKPVEMIQRPSPDEPTTRLLLKVSPSLLQALDKLKLFTEEEQGQNDDDSGEIKIGTACKNGGCSKTFEGPNGNEELCTFHAGVPIFHEGMKFWSCCKKRTSDFNTFLSQEGCTTGLHMWIKQDAGKKVVACRHDWHQTGGVVTITLYAKNAIPELSYVEANSSVVTLHFIFEGEKEFHQKVNLWGVIDVNRSNVTMTATKIEVTLRKSEPMTWARLELPMATKPEKKESDLIVEEPQSI